MSPTRRHFLKLSAGAVTAALAAPSLAPVGEAAPEIVPPGHIRKGKLLGYMFDEGSIAPDNESQGCEVFLDGDLDNTWTLWVKPGWFQSAITGERDCTGCIDCRDLTGCEAMSRVWRESHRRQPTIRQAADGFTFIRGLAEQTADPDLRNAARTWMKRRSEWCQEPGVRTLEELNARWWQMVVWNHPALDTVTGANAVIYYGQEFYLANLDMEPECIPGVA